MPIAYMDESGIHAGSAVCVVGGYWASRPAIRTFSKRWSRILQNFAITEFHSQEFWGRNRGKRVGVYRDWSEERAQECLDSLLDAISRSKIFPITAALVMEDWHKMSYGERRFLTGGQYRLRFRSTGAPGKPYFLPFQSCVLNAARHCKPGTKMHFRFDYNGEFKGYASHLFAAMKRMPLQVQEKLGRIRFPHGLGVPALQAADLLVYLVREHAEEKRRAKDANIPPSAVLARALTRHRAQGDNPYFNETGLRMAIPENLAETLRKMATRTD